MKHSLNKTSQKLMSKKQRFLNFLSTKILTNEQYKLRKNKTSGTDLFDSMKKFEK